MLRGFLFFLLTLLVLFAPELDGGEIVRNRVARDKFRRATGYPHGRSGYVVDHIVPLCACRGDLKCISQLDQPENMQWQSETDGKRKDKLVADCLLS